MWSDLPFDLLSNIFFFLSPDSFACAKAACRNWHQACASTPSFKNPFLLQKQLHPPWFIALPLRNNSLSCHAHNPINTTNNNWYEISLDFLPHPIRLVAHLEGLLLVRPSISTVLQLGVCNPFTRQYKQLPTLNIRRTNPAVGVISLPAFSNTKLMFGTDSFHCFGIYVAGGMSEAPRGGATYEPTLEMYDPQLDAWRVVGSMPMEFAVRLTVWTPKESVYCDGVLYWMTSARAYSLMGYDISSNSWRELSVPMADKLEFAVLVLRNGRLTLVGGTCALGVCIWELGEGESWVMVETVPSELGMRFIGEKGSWDRTKCVGSDGAIYLYRDLWAGMVVWREVGEGNSKWEWFWIEGCSSIRGKQVRNMQIKGVLMHPNLVPSSIF
ncbi:protein UNUSUAL FLORAL ORGANS-like [Rosa rugosa]|uniref:protein UNUSUAL FLORAL ORGANS-like n=1 Tax=Rosa rugosa TaxID=74645 RepID=UPI002B409043|nr:protein UNUSUAL FLORAL ORGANS-like [Rosa rugosa]